MDNKKPKEPLLALILAFVLPGLGQVYAGRFKRGILFFFIPILCAVPLLLYVLNPNTTTNLILLLLFIFLAGFQIFILVDSYLCARAYNIANNLDRGITVGKRILLIVGILFIALIFNPFEIIAVRLANYIRTNIAQAFRIPTGAMRPTIMEGDSILVDKAIYKKSEPKRGDVIVFIYPKDTKKMFAKRVVGLPGEMIEILNGSVLINGSPIKDGSIGSKYYYNRGDFAKEGQSITIPEDSYFTLGDNSASSMDSRYWGFVPKKYLIGKAYKIYFPFGRSGPIK